MKLVRCDWQRCNQEVGDGKHHKVVVFKIREENEERAFQVEMDACSPACAVELCKHYFMLSDTATVHVHKTVTARGRARIAGNVGPT